MVRVGFRQFVEEHLQAYVIHPRQVQAEALSRCGLHCRVQIGPLVGAPHYIWRAEAPGAIASLVPADEPEPGFVEGQDLQRLPAVALADTPYGGGEVF